MKRFFLSVLISLSAITVFGQEQEESLNQRFFDAKIREFVYRLELTDQQKAEFIPIYTRYNDEKRAAVGEREERPNPPATIEEAAEFEKARLERQRTIQAIRIKYVDEFAKVLNADQLTQLYRVENQIQQNLSNRKDGHGPGHGQGHDRGHGQGRGQGRGHGGPGQRNF